MKKFAIATLLIAMPMRANAQTYNVQPLSHMPAIHMFNPTNDSSNDRLVNMRAMMASPDYTFDPGKMREEMRSELAADAFSSPQYLARVQTYLRSGIGQSAAEALARRDIVAGTPALAAIYHDMYEQNDNAILAQNGMR
ncbi:hypothetical protein [Acetobacter pasteurianus]|uniref:hypothetical protein n=1 Tax=Acetobacter pasteurianus TaxID=438 RepID=UPI0011DD6107|nr:hypothetical protein [Acetobacter pasteurianus]